MKKLFNNSVFWEVIGYITLALCIFGQIAVGYVYLTAQITFLIANAMSVVRDITLKLPQSNIVKDIAFTAITIALIIIRIF